MVYRLRYHKSPVCKHPHIHHGSRLGHPDNYVASPQYYLIEISWEVMGSNMTYDVEGITAKAHQHELIALYDIEDHDTQETITN